MIPTTPITTTIEQLKIVTNTSLTKHQVNIKLKVIISFLEGVEATLIDLRKENNEEH